MKNDIDYEVMIEDLGDAVNESLKTMNTGKANEGIYKVEYMNYQILTNN